MSNRTDSDRSEAGTKVDVSIRIFKVESVTPADGKLSLKIWFRMSWLDERLSWEPARFGGVSEIQVRAAYLSDAQGSEIWTPDVVPYNSNEGITATLDPAIASVLSSGDVFWSRPGTLSLLCGFSGLNNFPYDTLKCPTDVGGWMLGSDLQVRTPCNGHVTDT